MIDWKKFSTENLEEIKMQINKELETREDREEFEIPSMYVMKDDILALYKGRDDFDKIKEIVENLSNNEMQEIANRMTDMLMDEYHVVLRESFDRTLDIKYMEKENEI